jgi:hypothetical protein
MSKSGENKGEDGFWVELGRNVYLAHEAGDMIKCKSAEQIRNRFWS